MDNISPVKARSQIDQFHFLGYWGFGNKQELDALLIHKQANTALGERDRPQLIWNVVRFRPDPTSPDCKLEISASGIQSSPDAWVRLKKDTLVLGREAFGKVPLYWMQKGEVIWFASQLQMLLPLIDPIQVSIPAFYGYNCFSYVPTPSTPVCDVFAVKANTEMIWQGNSNSLKLSSPINKTLFEWQQSSKQIYDLSTAVDSLQNLLKEAIHRQITDLKDEPVGVFLSGGLDSSIVAALLVQAGVKVRAYTLDFGNVGIPEYSYAEKVATYLNVPLTKVQATPSRIQKNLIPTVKALDLPFGDGVTVPLYLLSQVASQETRVVFNGEGGDQLFAGWTNKPLIAAGIYQNEHPAGNETFIQQYLRTFHRLWGYESKVYQPFVCEQIKNIQASEWLQQALDPSFCKDLLHRLRRASLMLKGAQNIHPRATNLAIAHGLKVRSPFCDLAIASFSFQVSGELFLEGACEKYILKRAVENWLPEEIVWRQKRGMGVPLTSWCLQDFWHQIGNWLNPGVLSSENRFLPQIATEIVAGKLGAGITGRRVGEILWLLIMWELWRVYVLGEAQGKATWDHPFWLPRWMWRGYKQWCDVVLW